MAMQAKVVWVAEDIVDAFNRRGKKLSEAQAEEWLMDNASQIENRLTELGWEVIDALIEA